MIQCYMLCQFLSPLCILFCCRFGHGCFLFCLEHLYKVRDLPLLVLTRFSLQLLQLVVSSDAEVQADLSVVCQQSALLSNLTSHKYLVSLIPRRAACVGRAACRHCITPLLTQFSNALWRLNVMFHYDTKITKHIPHCSILTNSAKTVVNGLLLY